MIASVPLTEDELSKVLFYIPDSEDKLRTLLQSAGRNIYNW